MIRFRQFIVASLAAGLALSVNAAGQTTEGTALLLSKARSLEARGRMDLAVQNWNQVLLLEPDQTDALAGLARSAKQEGDLQGMRMLLDRLRKVNPKDPNIVAIEKMHVPSPTEIKKLLDAGRLATGQKFDEAMAIYRQVFGDAPPPGKWAESFYDTEASSTGGREKAIADLRALAARDPANEVYRLWLARVLTYSPQTRMEGFHLLEAIHDPGTMEQARAIWRQALVWEKDNPSAQASLQAYLQRYSDQDLQKSLTNLRERQDRAGRDATEQSAFQALQGNDIDTAQATFERMLRGTPNDANALAGLGFVRLSQKRFDEALTLFERARTLAPRRPEDVAEGAQTARFWRAMERGRALAPNDPAAAIAAYEMALAVRPQDEGPVLGILQLIATYVERRDLDRALTALRAMSPRAFDAAAKHPDFLNAAAFVYSADGQCAEAETLLTRSLATAKARGQVPAERTVMELAGIWMRERRFDKASQAYHDVIASNPSSVDAWREYLTALHEAHDDRKVATEAGRAPATVSETLANDTGFLTLLASADTAIGDNDRAVERLRRARARYEFLQQTPPPDLDVQLAWAMLDSSGSQQDLAKQITVTLARTDLSVRQRRAIEDVWSVWRVRAAQDAAQNEDYVGAIEILTRAGRDLPASANIRSALASLYMSQHDYDHALDVYKSWGMTDAAAGDYRAAAGAAFASHKNVLGERYLLEGRQHWPGDAELLHMTAMNALEKEQYDDAAHYLRSTLARLRAEEANGADAGSRSKANRPADKSGSSTVSGADSLPSGPVSPAPVAACRTGVNDGTRTLSTAVPPAGQKQVAEHDLPQMATERVQDELDVVQHRNTPFADIRAPFTSRSGSPGIDHLITQDAVIGGSVTIGDVVRLGAAAHAIDLNSGTPDGRSGYRFGTLPLGAVFPEQRVSGLGAELQASTDGYGFAVGMSPKEFPVQNWTGGIRFGRPDDGLVLFATRDHVKDSLLSYAGSIDPRTGSVWGGVISNSASLHFSHDASGTGQYLSLGAASIKGHDVADNWSVEGTAGGYWRILDTGQGGLSVGVSATGIHYDKNLNFFSLGQGGYFSPQQYWLGSIPVSWHDRRAGVVYEFSASGGFQSIREDASPYYPTRPFAGQPNYEGHVTTGPNYNFAAHLEYQASPHFYIEGFATANNARNYASQAVGVGIKLLIERLPTRTSLHPKSLPDWRGRQPFGS
jgi:tetratricopeptide (TPR) repeat protein